VLALDHIYFDPSLVLEGLTVHRTRTSLLASDHLPLVADFAFGAEAAGEEVPDVEALPCVDERIDS
jgi:hypothetical protein